MTQKTALKVLVEKPTEQKLKELGVFAWPIWEKGPSTFVWNYEEKEICYFLEGSATATTKAGEVVFGKGDLVTFPQGLECVWTIKTAVKKHYKFG